jgi:hypothetical protein
VYGALRLTDVSTAGDASRKRIGTNENGTPPEGRSPTRSGEGLPSRFARRGRLLRAARVHVKDAIGEAGSSARSGRLRLRPLELEFTGEDGHARRPVMLHRAILTSGRFFVFTSSVAGVPGAARPRAGLARHVGGIGRLATEAATYLRGKGSAS